MCKSTSEIYHICFNLVFDILSLSEMTFLLSRKGIFNFRIRKYSPIFMENPCKPLLIKGQWFPHLLRCKRSFLRFFLIRPIPPSQTCIWLYVLQVGTLKLNVIHVSCAVFFGNIHVYCFCISGYIYILHVYK